MAEDESKEIAADDWAAALAEQATTAAPAEDDWSAAMAEQVSSESAAAASQPQVTPANIFEQLTPGMVPSSAGNLDMILDIPVNLTVELGRTKIAIRSLLQLAQGSVVELDGLAGEPMDVLVNGCLIAQGEVVVVNDKFGIRLTDIINPSERLRRLHR